MLANTNYELIRLIGKGGMAEVWLAHHKLLKHPVAVKVLNPEFCANENIRKRFLAEARNIFMMNHPNIIKVTDLIEQAGSVAFVMEHFDGMTIKEHLQARGKLTPEEVIIIFNQMTESVSYVHQLGLIHRDIKPSNFMIDKNGLVKLLDFGIAKNTDINSTEYTQTSSSQGFGTPMYMSPEQITSAKEVTYKSDIYSLGVVLWQLVTTKLPYDPDKNSMWQIQTKIVSERLPLTGTVFDELIQLCTEPDPDNRPTNSAELYIDRNALFSGTRVKTTAPSTDNSIQAPPPPPPPPPKRKNFFKF